MPPAPRPGWSRAACFGAALALLAVVAPAPLTTALRPAAAPAVTTVPAYDHIFIIMMENTNRTKTGKAQYLIGNPQAPFLNRLATAGAQSSNYHGVTHPSLPNYMAAVSGNVEAKISNSCHPGVGTCTTSAPNILDRVEASGRTWRAYMESMPVVCDVINSKDGLYKTHFNPFVYFSQVRTSSRCQSDVPFTQFGGDLSSAASTASFVWITPNTMHDMHKGTVAQGDAFASSTANTIFNSPAWTTQRSLLVVTWDENFFTSSNNVAFIAVSSNGSTRPGYVSTTAANHYSLLRTVEASWGLATCGSGDASASPMVDLFQ